MTVFVNGVWWLPIDKGCLIACGENIQYEASTKTDIDFCVGFKLWKLPSYNTAT